MSQYALNISHTPVFSDSNFVVSACNREAWQWLESWPNWPAHGFYLYGPQGSGKSHLAHIWARKAQASILDCASVTDDDITSLRGNLLLEDIERLQDEQFLFHLYNASKEQGSHLLLTSRLSARDLPFRLPDLTSRINALPSAAIAEADDEALAAALRKQFADRQMKVADDVIAYLLPRTSRSFYKIRELVEKLDRASLAERKSLTIPYVRHFLSLPLG
jgi:DnaA regulatory inactivator Hda